MEIKAPNKYALTRKFTVFLAGAIDQGQAVNWQAKVARALDNYDVLVLNPRRDNWNDRIEQSASNLEFVEQVVWELQGQEAANLVVYVFPEHSKAPITFMEFGLFCRTKRICMVCAEDGFYRKGNLEVVTNRYKIPLYSNLDKMIQHLQSILARKGYHRPSQINLEIA